MKKVLIQLQPKVQINAISDSTVFHYYRCRNKNVCSTIFINEKPWLIKGHLSEFKIEMIKYHLGSSLPSLSSVPFFLEHLSTGISTFAMLQLVINVDYNSLQEAQLICVDSLGFDVRVCSGTQVQTLRFGFKKRVPQLSFVATYLNAYIF